MTSTNLIEILKITIIIYNKSPCRRAAAVAKIPCANVFSRTRQFESESYNYFRDINDGCGR